MDSSSGWDTTRRYRSGFVYFGAFVIEFVEAGGQGRGAAVDADADADADVGGSSVIGLYAILSGCHFIFDF